MSISNRYSSQSSKLMVNIITAFFINMLIFDNTLILVNAKLKNNPTSHLKNYQITGMNEPQNLDHNQRNKHNQRILNLLNEARAKGQEKKHKLQALITMIRNRISENNELIRRLIEDNSGNKNYVENPIYAKKTLNIDTITEEQRKKIISTNEDRMSLIDFKKKKSNEELNIQRNYSVKKLDEQKNQALSRLDKVKNQKFVDLKNNLYRDQAEFNRGWGNSNKNWEYYQGYNKIASNKRENEKKIRDLFYSVKNRIIKSYYAKKGRVENNSTQRKKILEKLFVIDKESARKSTQAIYNSINSSKYIKRNKISDFKNSIQKLKNGKNKEYYEILRLERIDRDKQFKIWSKRQIDNLDKENSVRIKFLESKLIKKYR